MSRGYDRGVKIGPFDELLKYFTGSQAVLPCIWQDNCAHGFICIDPEGYVSQCDCWAASYPNFRFGNIFEDNSLSALLGDSPARRQFLSRPASLVDRGECIHCEYLAICHGGCPVRAYATSGRLSEKDPYCQTYQTLFGHMQKLATTGPCLG